VPVGVRAMGEMMNVGGAANVVETIDTEAATAAMIFERILFSPWGIDRC